MEESWDEYLQRMQHWQAGLTEAQQAELARGFAELEARFPSVEAPDDRLDFMQAVGELRQRVDPTVR
jgi:hypothetical protein